MDKQQHQKWLKNRGLTRDQIKIKKKQLGCPNTIPTYTTNMHINTSNNIPCNGLKDSDITKAEFCKKNYAMVPAYNKGPIMVVSKEEIKYAGRK